MTLLYPIVAIAYQVIAEQPRYLLIPAMIYYLFLFSIFVQHRDKHIIFLMKNRKWAVYALAPVAICIGMGEFMMAVSSDMQYTYTQGKWKEVMNICTAQMGVAFITSICSVVYTNALIYKKAHKYDTNY